MQRPGRSGSFVHVWMAPVLQGRFVRFGGCRLRSCVRPLARSSDRRPRWVPRSEASTILRARWPGARTRLPSLRRTTDPPSRFLPSQAHADPNGAAMPSRVGTRSRGACTAQAMRASLLASATAATRRGRRASSAFSQGLASTALGQRSTAWAPVISSRRRSRVAALADPAQPRLAAARVLARHQPQPGRELAPAAEGGRVGDGRRQGAGGHRPDPGDGRQPPAGRAGAVPGQQLPAECRQPRRQLLELLDQHQQDPARRLGHAVLGLVADHRGQLRHVARALGRDDAELGQMARAGR